MNALEEEEEEEEEEEWEDPPEEEDPDQVAYADEEGWLYADEDTINAVDETIAYDDPEYAAQVITYTEARNALAKARIARGFYPVVVPADDGRQPRFNRSKKGDGKGKSRAQPKKKPTTSSTNGPGKVIGLRQGWGKGKRQRARPTVTHMLSLQEKRASE